MKPTIEEVKQYFKNAKEVRCVSDKKVYDITKNITKDIYQFLNSFWIDKDNKDILLYGYGYNDKKEYAEIISYKEETLPIKKSVLLQLAENNSFSESIIKKEFPQLFESELEVGKWYKSNKKYFKSIIFITEIKQCQGYRKVFYYGIVNGDFKTDYFASEDIEKNLNLSEEQEVFEALTNEAVKRGFKEGINVKAPKGTTGIITDNFSHEFRVESNKFYFHNMCVFDNGTWAEICKEKPKEITISEIEKILGYKILIKE